MNEDQTNYFNNIYKDTNSNENFITSFKTLPQGGNAFYVLTTPQKDCDRIYLTTTLYLSDVPSRGIFERRINTNEISELKISKALRQQYVPYPFKDKKAVSSDGEKIVISQRTEAYTQQDFCDFRTLKLLNLREDTSEILLQLPQSETFDDGTSDLSPYCNGLNFGWIDNSTIYYNVYDATVEGKHPLIERRTLSIE